MPLYEYECESCGRRVEVIQRVGGAPLGACERCGGVMRRLLSAPAFQFKGSGWYVTDYARKGASGDGTKPAQETQGPAAAADAKDKGAKDKEKGKETKAGGEKSGGSATTGATTKEASGASG